MKKLVILLFGVFLVQMNSKAQLLGGGLSGTGNRILQANSSGEIIPLTTGTGTLSATTFSATTNVASPLIVTNRVTSTDSIIHIGDSSVIINAQPIAGYNPITSANTYYDKITSSYGHLALGSATALGGSSMALGVSSVLFGSSAAQAKAYGGGSLAMGSGETEADGFRTMALGSSVRTGDTADYAISIGSGIEASGGITYMTNNTPRTLAVGFNSNVPTLFVTGGNGTSNSTGKVAIGYAPANYSNHNNNPNPYKTLTVYGDVSFANYNSSGNNPTDGLNGTEILGGDKVPTRRGISTDDDPYGDMNFFINPNQNASNTEFHFKIGANPNLGYANYGSAAAAPSLMTLNGSGDLTLNSTGSAAPFTINNAGTKIFQIDNTGTIHIGPTYPRNTPYSSARISVDGMFVAKELWVVDQQTGGWADYVFKKDYSLMPLTEVENYISKNQHLPNIPSANEIEKQGQNIGKLQVLQMEKIEEITLYLIEMKKENAALKKEVEELKGKLR